MNIAANSHAKFHVRLASRLDNSQNIEKRKPPATQTGKSLYLWSDLLIPGAFERLKPAGVAVTVKQRSHINTNAFIFVFERQQSGAKLAKQFICNE